MNLLESLIQEYRVLAQGLSANDLYKQARHNGVNKLHAFVLLRELYDYNLQECEHTADQVEGQHAAK